MNDKELTHDDFLQRLDIRDVLLDAGYRQNRRFGLRLSSFIRTDSEGKRIRGDKFVITQHGKCCCQPPRQKEYNVVSFIKEHPHLFAEYHEGINPDRLVELVCYRLLHYPIPEQETRTGQPQRDTRPFDIADYNIQKFDPQDRGTQEKFAPYFEKRGIDLCTQQTFHRDFCLATRHSEDGQRRTCLAFPMTLPEDADKIVGFEKRGHAYTDGNSSYDDMIVISCMMQTDLLNDIICISHSNAFDIRKSKHRIIIFAVTDHHGIFQWNLIFLSIKMNGCTF